MKGDSALVDALLSDSSVLVPDLEPMTLNDERRGPADLLFRSKIDGRLHFVYARRDPNEELVRAIGKHIRALKAEGGRVAGWLVSARIRPDIDDAALSEHVQTRELRAADLPVAGNEDVADRPKLRGRHGLRKRVSDATGLTELAPAVRDFVIELERRGYEVNHGGNQTHLIYRGQGIGGIHRGTTHGYLSKLMVTDSFEERLRHLGFERERMPRKTGAFSEHRWFGVDLVTHLPAFAQAIAELEPLIDAELDRGHAKLSPRRVDGR